MPLKKQAQTAPHDLAQTAKIALTTPEIMIWFVGLIRNSPYYNRSYSLMNSSNIFVPRKSEWMRIYSSFVCAVP